MSEDQDGRASGAAPMLDATTVLEPDWALADAGVRALFTTRAGGISSAPFDSLNLGDHVGDVPDSVAGNRARLTVLLRQRGVRGDSVFLRQVHGVGVVEPGAGAGTGACADAAVTAIPGVACTVLVADCLPVLFGSADGRVVAAAHAGWRGLAGMPADGPAIDGPRPGILEATLQRMQLVAARDGAAHPPAVLAWLGPCIGPRAFEVGADVRAAFGVADADCFTPVVGRSGKYWADLPQLARRRLAAAGVRQVDGNDGSDAWCTVSQAGRFFSHRRDAARLGSTGRMAASIWIDAGG